MSHPVGRIATMPRWPVKQMVLVRKCRACDSEFAIWNAGLLCIRCALWDLCHCGGPKVKRARTCRGCQDLTGPRNGHWRGGRKKEKKGYALVWRPDHPRSPANHGYVFEHTIVMEAQLGRYLLPGETVHHMNGVRDDNRIENLELWCKPQPVGVRAVDAVDWAREVLHRYEALDLERREPSP